MTRRGAVRIGLGDGGDEAGPWKLVYCLANYTADGDATLSHKGQTFGQMLGPVFLDVLGDDDAELGPPRGMAAMQSTLPGRRMPVRRGRSDSVGGHVPPAHPITGRPPACRATSARV